MGHTTLEDQKAWQLSVLGLQNATSTGEREEQLKLLHGFKCERESAYDQGRGLDHAMQLAGGGVHLFWGTRLSDSPAVTAGEAGVRAI